MVDSSPELELYKYWLLNFIHHVFVFVYYTYFLWCEIIFIRNNYNGYFLLCQFNIFVAIYRSCCCVTTWDITISNLVDIHALLNLSVLGLCLRMNDSGLFAWIGLTALSRTYFILIYCMYFYIWYRLYHT